MVAGTAKRTRHCDFEYGIYSRLSCIHYDKYCAIVAQDRRLIILTEEIGTFAQHLINLDCRSSPGNITRKKIVISAIA